MKTHPSRRGRARWLGALLVLSASLPFTCGAIREDEFLCNEAVEHLHDCCPENSVLPSDFCAVRSSCDAGHSAGLSVAQSRCIIGRSCDELQTMCTHLLKDGDAGPGSCL